MNENKVTMIALSVLLTLGSLSPLQAGFDRQGREVQDAVSWACLFYAVTWARDTVTSWVHYLLPSNDDPISMLFDMGRFQLDPRGHLLFRMNVEDAFTENRLFGFNASTRQALLDNENIQILALPGSTHGQDIGNQAAMLLDTPEMLDAYLANESFVVLVQMDLGSYDTEEDEGYRRLLRLLSNIPATNAPQVGTLSRVSFILDQFLQDIGNEIDRLNVEIEALENAPGPTNRECLEWLNKAKKQGNAKIRNRKPKSQKNKLSFNDVRGAIKLERKTKILRLKASLDSLNVLQKGTDTLIEWLISGLVLGYKEVLTLCEQELNEFAQDLKILESGADLQIFSRGLIKVSVALSVALEQIMEEVALLKSDYYQQAEEANNNNNEDEDNGAQVQEVDIAERLEMIQYYRAHFSDDLEEEVPVNNNNNENEPTKKIKKKTRGQAFKKGGKHEKNKGKKEKNEAVQETTPEGSNVLLPSDSVLFEAYLRENVNDEILNWILEDGARHAIAPQVSEDDFETFGDSLITNFEIFLIDELGWNESNAIARAEKLRNNFKKHFHKYHNGGNNELPANYMQVRLRVFIQAGFFSEETLESLKEIKVLRKYLTGYFSRLLDLSKR